MHWSGGILGRGDPIGEALPMPVATRFLPSVGEGRDWSERQENGRFPSDHAGPVGGDEIRQENPLQKSLSDRALGAIFSEGSQRHRVRSATGTPSYPWSAGT
jgi:hypothetical protein